MLILKDRPRVFESHPLRQNINGPVFRPFFILGVRGVWTNPLGSTKIAARFLDAAALTRRSGAKRRTSGRPRPRAIPPSPPFMPGFAGVRKTL